MIKKELLLAIIRGLTTRQGQTQYDNGTPVISGKNYELLIEYIKNAQSHNWGYNLIRC